MTRKRIGQQRTRNKPKNKAEKLMAAISAEFFRTSGFDIADTEVTTINDVFSKADRAIQWFRDWANETEDDMERILREYRKKHRVEE